MVQQEIAKKQQESFEAVPFRVHPRVFAALGADLVTDDFVAVIELVKNSYDAFAQNVRLEFAKNSDGNNQLRIIDDGTGMTRETIEDAWCTVATPFKDSNPTISKGGKVRRVVGEKGLGRLSAARLGNHLRMLTKAVSSPCWEVIVDWSVVAQGKDLSECSVRIREFRGIPPFKRTGTSLSISGLSKQWDAERIGELEENLVRLISPFSEVKDFTIVLHGFGDEESEETKISSPEFLSRPKYSFKGTADDNGNIEGIYQFSPIGQDKAVRVKRVSRAWETIVEGGKDNQRSLFSPESSSCGPFSFEIRAWDIATVDTGEISEAFDMQRSFIRKAIKAHRGISVYRDNVLVLPKSEKSRDWLGLDLRRVSYVGPRLSTSQVVGYVSISADDNPKIRDTSDRERLASCVEVSEFETIVMAVVELLEVERNSDRTHDNQETPLNDLFSKLTADPLIEEIDTLAEEGAKMSAVVSVVRAFRDSLDSTRNTIVKRLVYFSRLATIGTIAQMLVHEIRNRTIVIGSALRLIKSMPTLFLSEDDGDKIRAAQAAIDSLESLADRFAPLASRSFRRGRRNSNLEDRIRGCLSMHQREIRSKGIKTKIPDSQTMVSVDPGELDAIILNLVTNATYWMGEVPRGKRILEFVIESINDGKRVRLWANDSGPGLEDEEIEKVFWPGVTRKPDGIGMGLTVASELVEAHGGKMLASHPGELDGASFAFDLPVVGK